MTITRRRIDSNRPNTGARESPDETHQSNGETVDLATALAQPTARTNGRTRQEHANLINSAWRKGTEVFLETGSRLIEAKQELDAADYRAMIEEDLLMSPSTARKLRIIARNPILSDRSHVNALPACYSTLYELSQIEPETLKALIEDGTINAKLERAEATTLRTGRSTAQRAIDQHQRTPTTEPVRAAGNGHDWGQHEESGDHGDAGVEEMIDDIDGLFDPLRQRIGQVQNGRSRDAKGALADALREHGETAKRLANKLSPVESES